MSLPEKVYEDIKGFLKFAAVVFAIWFIFSVAAILWYWIEGHYVKSIIVAVLTAGCWINFQVFVMLIIQDRVLRWHRFWKGLFCFVVSLLFIFKGVAFGAN